MDRPRPSDERQEDLAGLAATSPAGRADDRAAGPYGVPARSPRVSSATEALWTLPAAKETDADAFPHRIHSGGDVALADEDSKRPSPGRTDSQLHEETSAVDSRETDGPPMSSSHLVSTGGFPDQAPLRLSSFSRRTSSGFNPSAGPQSHSRSGGLEQARPERVTDERSPHSSGGSSSTRRRPAPLEFSQEAVEAARFADSLDDEATPDSPPTADFRTLHISRPSPKEEWSERSPRETESSREPVKRDLSSSPVIETSIPSSRLSLSDVLVLDKDDTVASAGSYLASSTNKTTSSSTAFPSSSPRARLASSQGGYQRSRWPSGTMPASASAAANLSSFATSQSPFAAGRQASHHSTASVPASPSSPQDTASRHVGLSPVVDRAQLVGLGELATPRWTSDALELRWQSSGAGSGSSQTKVSPSAATRGTVFPSPDDYDSPTLVRPGPRPPLGRNDSSFETSNRPFGRSPGAAQLLPASTSAATLALDASPAGLLHFDAKTSGESCWNGSGDPPSPGSSQEVPRRRVVSGPNKEFRRGAPAAGTTESWALSSPARESNVGLGIVGNSPAGGESPRPLGNTSSPVRSRVSSSGAASASSRRSSGRPVSVDGKTSGKALRRHSSGKSSFAHLPPSPATSASAHVMTASPGADPSVPAMPALAGFPRSPVATSTSASATSTPSTRTPEQVRQSRPSTASHQSSPSIVAASILKQTREQEGADVDFEEAAAHDQSTALALARLDGLNSPRLSRIASGERFRKTSKGPAEGLAPPSRRTSRQVDRRRSSSGPVAVQTEQIASPPSPRSPSTAVAAPATTISSPAAPQQQPRSSAGTSSEVPFPASLPTKRGSSSSTSWTGGSFSGAGSLDSTSATSYATRSPASKHRRSSVSSDHSSVQGGVEGRPALDRRGSGDETKTVADIPPVPPLPKDWETYRPRAGDAAPTQLDVPRSPAATSQSPRQTRTETSSPRTLRRAAGATVTSPTTEATHSEEPTSPKGEAPSPAGHTRRKWSISNAFHKATRSPKANVKESTSFSDLQSAAGKNIRRTAAGHLADSALPRRMAASTSNLSTLSGDDAQTPAKSPGSSNGFGSLGRNTLRSSSFLRARTSSYSSRTATAAAGGSGAGCDMPSVVQTSPGKSRTNAFTSRRTPSGIPFFSRKNSSGDMSETGQESLASPVLGSATPASTTTSEDKGGRKSIMGLNFLRPGGSASKRGKDKATLSPQSSTHSTFSTSQASLELSAIPSADEFGRRPSLAAPKATAQAATTSRKRSKTLSSADQGDVFRRSETEQLPPLHMPALPPATALRVDSFGSGHGVGATKDAPPRTRANRLQDSVKANLPTIAGSPSTAAPSQVGSSSATDRTPSGTPPPKSHTPTRIPRLQRGVGNPTPRTSPSLGPGKAARRLSSQSSLQGHKLGPTEATAGAAASSAAPAASGRTRASMDNNASGIPRSRSTSSRASITNLAGQRSAVESGTAQVVKATPLRTAERLPNLSASTSRLPSTATGVAKSGARSSAAPDSSTSTRYTRATEGGTRRVSVPPAEPALDHHLPTSRSARNVSSKASLSSRASHGTSTTRLSPAATESGRSSSASGNMVTEDELRGDEEMAAYARRQRTKRLAAGMDANAVRKLFDFPEPTRPLPPLTAGEALSLYSRYLSSYEKSEIRDYRDVYFVGPNCDKKPATVEAAALNHGYDDDRGDYLMVPHDHIQYRYEVIDVLGKGSFGQVLQCRDHKTGDMVAVKIIRNKKRFHHQALVEVKVLENLVRWDPDEKHFVIRMIESFTFRGHLCIVTELLSINLYELVKANSFAGFSTTLIRRFSVQILGCLSLLRHHRVVHCDLKPENILLRHPSKSGVKVIDFGSSCFENEKVYTYIQSRFYRSPEVILGQNYHMAIDMWSLGCIMAEMFTGYPIFPGENEQEQLACIMEILGVPDKYLVDRSSRKRLFFDSTGAPRPVVNSKGRRRRPNSKSLAQALKSDDELFVDFIGKCLAWDPDRRLKPDQAMRHPWIAQTRAGSQSSSLPARSNRASSATAGSASSASRRVSTTQTANPTIGTPQRLKPTLPPSVSTAPHGRTRTASSSIANSASSTRTQVKSSLPAPTRYSVKS